MLGESAKYLVNSSRISGTSLRGGILTPAVCFGVDFFEHLKKAGIDFSLEDTITEA
jgi:short subunit dehydrogenase-like uncharacterized protein